MITMYNFYTKSFKTLVITFRCQFSGGVFGFNFEELRALNLQIRRE